MATKVKPEAVVKPDPEATASPSAMSEDDLYEDAGDLDFYDASLPQDPQGSMYLTHVPKYLYDAWESLKDDEEIQIGTIRQWTQVEKNGQSTMRLAMLLDTKNPVHQPIPKEYNLEIKDMNLTNTFIFTEQDLPGFKNKGHGANSNIPAHLRPKPERVQDKSKPDQAGGKRRFQPYYRKAIPKKTVLAGRLRHELSCQPVDNAETRAILATRAADALKPKATTNMVTTTRDLQNGIAPPGTRDKFSGFVRAADPKAKPKKKQVERAARLEQHVLRDKIFELFSKYRYWAMKGFKQQLSQPEAWLRENLDLIAVLHKSGRFANHWELKAEYQTASAAVDGSVAPDVTTDGNDSDMDGDDDDIEMEDVA